MEVASLPHVASTEQRKGRKKRQQDAPAHGYSEAAEQRSSRNMLEKSQQTSPLYVVSHCSESVSHTQTHTHTHTHTYAQPHPHSRVCLVCWERKTTWHASTSSVSRLINRRQGGTDINERKSPDRPTKIWIRRCVATIVRRASVSTFPTVSPCLSAVPRRASLVSVSCAITLHVDRQDSEHVALGTHTYQYAYVWVCGCKKVFVCFFVSGWAVDGVGVALHNVIYFWRNCGREGSASHIAPVFNASGIGPRSRQVGPGAEPGRWLLST